MKRFRALVFLLVPVVTIHAQQLKENDVPPNVKAVVRAHNKGEKVSVWIKDGTRGTYVATSISESYLATVETSLKGDWIRTTTALEPASLPLAVMATLRTTYLNKGYEGSNYVQVEEPNQVLYYAMEVTSEDETLELRINPKGRIVSKVVQ